MGPEIIGALIALAAKYGPDVVQSVINLWKNSHAAPVSVADVEAAFSRLKDYKAYQIPDVVLPPANVTGQGPL